MATHMGVPKVLKADGGRNVVGMCVCEGGERRYGASESFVLIA